MGQVKELQFVLGLWLVQVELELWLVQMELELGLGMQLLLA